MRNHEEIFTDSWLKNSQYAGEDSWAFRVWRDRESDGSVYLEYIRNWYQHLPLGSATKEQLRKRLENYKTEDHLGGVNELAWWVYMKQRGFDVVPIDTTDASRPDFHVKSPSEFIVEVTTLNSSRGDNVAFYQLAGAHLDQEATVRRIIAKANEEEKRAQFKYGADKGLASVLVLFDYSAFSGYGTQTEAAIEQTLLTETDNFSQLPHELSALIYVEKTGQHGKPAFVRSKTVVFHNPSALHPISLDPFSDLIQHTREQVIESEPGLNPLIYLCKET